MFKGILSRFIGVIFILFLFALAEFFAAKDAYPASESGLRGEWIGKESKSGGKHILLFEDDGSFTWHLGDTVVTGTYELKNNRLMRMNVGKESPEHIEYSLRQKDGAFFLEKGKKKYHFYRRPIRLR